MRRKTAMLFLCSRNPWDLNAEFSRLFSRNVAPDLAWFTWANVSLSQEAAYLIQTWTLQLRLHLPAAPTLAAWGRRVQILKVSPVVCCCSALMLTTGRKLIWYLAPLSFSETWRNLWAVALQAGKIIWFSKWKMSNRSLVTLSIKWMQKKYSKCETQHTATHTSVK